MTFWKKIRAESGYTLLETIVAMALFLSVLIPLGVTIGNFTLDNSASQISSALHMAQAEMSHTILLQDFESEKKKESKAGFILERTTTRNGILVDISISVCSIKHPDKKLLTISKSLLDYQ